MRHRRSNGTTKRQATQSPRVLLLRSRSARLSTRVASPGTQCPRLMDCAISTSLIIRSIFPRRGSTASAADGLERLLGHAAFNLPGKTDLTRMYEGGRLIKNFPRRDFELSSGRTFNTADIYFAPTTRVIRFARGEVISPEHSCLCSARVSFSVLLAPTTRTHSSLSQRQRNQSVSRHSI